LTKVDQLGRQGALMQTMNLYEAKTHLSHLVEQAANGHEMVIAKAGKPLAKLVPYLSKKPLKREIPFGILKGKIKLAANFYDLMTP
jgi:prevent-host-death family protein